MVSWNICACDDSLYVTELNSAVRGAAPLHCDCASEREAAVIDVHGVIRHGFSLGVLSISLQVCTVVLSEWAACDRLCVIAMPDGLLRSAGGWHGATENTNKVE